MYNSENTDFTNAENASSRLGINDYQLENSRDALYSEITERQNVSIIICHTLPY